MIGNLNSQIELRHVKGSSNTTVSSRFYEYGGMKFGQETKLHICDDSGKALCGVKSNWMEAGNEIDSKGYLETEKHLFPITEMECTCKKCLNKWRSLNGC